MPDMNLTKLEAVNRILRAAREHPVSSLTTGSTNDSLLAEQILDDVLTREQMTGLHVNQTEAAFTRGSDNKILLPSNTLAVKGWNQHVFKNYYHKEVDGEVLLFDADNQPATSDFSSNGADEATVYLRITWRATFDELPSAYQFSIVDQAAVEYQESVLGDPGLGTKLEQPDRIIRWMTGAVTARAGATMSSDHGRITTSGDNNAYQHCSSPVFHGWS